MINEEERIRVEEEKKEKEEKFRRTLKKMRIALCVAVVFAAVLLGLGISTLVKYDPFGPDKIDGLMPKAAAICLTAFGAISAFAAFFLTFFSIVIPAMTKYTATIGGKFLEANKDNIAFAHRIGAEQFKNAMKEDEKGYCRYCGKNVPADSAFCPYCGQKLK